LPITIKVAGKYHDIGAFSADIANLSRIVTLHDLSISSGTDKKDTTNLVMDATARTYRYLDQAEIKAVKDAANATKAGGAKK
jgi:type IV pilus assembly protein PilO